LEVIEIENIDDLGILVQNTSRDFLEKIYRKQIWHCGERDTRKEKPWFNENIREEIKKRKVLNRERRNESNIENREQKKFAYEKQKSKVQNMIKNEISKFEEKIAREIREDKSKKQVWKCIKKLQGKEIEREELKLFDESGNCLSEMEERTELRKIWKNIFEKHSCDLGEIWNQDLRESYRNKMIGEKNSKMVATKTEFKINEVDEVEKKTIVLKFDREIREHIDMVMSVEETISPMNSDTIQPNDIVAQIRRMKTGKSPGPDGLKAEIYKELMLSPKYILTLTRAMNLQLLNNSRVPEKWKKSKTVMIKKKSKPTATDLRPIALTNLEYKIFMGVIRDKIECHIERVGAVRENQAGFSKGRRIEDNLIILRYCVEESKKRKLELYVAAIDFSKAFDSVNRVKLLEVLMEFKIDHKILDQVAQIYDGDWTEMWLRDDLKEEFNITSGIRQGCTGSSVLFKLVTYKIMEEIDNKIDGFQNDAVKLTSLFFADDGLIMSHSKKEIEKSIEIVINKSRYYGLDLNKMKSNILIFNGKDIDYAEIGGIKVVDEIVYLGVTVANHRNIFSRYKKKVKDKALRLSNVTSVVVEKSVSRLIIGKTYWKNVALPSFLHAMNVVSWTGEEMKNLQKIENGAMRKIMSARSYTPICVLRGEIGMSLMETRIIRSRLKYEAYMRTSGNGLLKIILEDMESKKHTWCKENEKYRLKIGYGEDKRNNEKIEEYIERKSLEYDSKKWRDEIDEKASLGIYKMWKSKIEEVGYYEGDYKSKLWFEARSNTLKLRDRMRFVNESTECRLCGAENEDIEHFILDCVELGVLRRKSILLQQPYEQEKRNIIGRFLFDECCIYEKKNILMEMYSVRQQKEEEMGQLV